MEQTPKLPVRWIMMLLIQYPVHDTHTNDDIASGAPSHFSSPKSVAFVAVVAILRLLGKDTIIS